MNEADALPARLRRGAGADVSYDRVSPLSFAAIVVFDAESLELVDVAAPAEVNLRRLGSRA